MINKYLVEKENETIEIRNCSKLEQLGDTIILDNKISIRIPEIKRIVKLDATNEEYLQAIEKALGVSLYQFQKDFILGKDVKMPKERQCGKTYAYCIKLALNKELTINMMKLEQFTDENVMIKRNYYSYFRDMFMEIRYKLERAGFEVCQIKYRFGGK